MAFTKIDFEQARVKHILFKYQLRALLTGAEIDETPVQSEHECSLADWIKNNTFPVTATPELQELKRAHKAIHAIARELIKKYRDGKTEEAWQGLDSINTTAEELVQALHALEAKLVK